MSRLHSSVVAALGPLVVLSACDYPSRASSEHRSADDILTLTITDRPPELPFGEHAEFTASLANKTNEAVTMLTCSTSCGCIHYRGQLTQVIPPHTAILLPFEVSGTRSGTFQQKITVLVETQGSQRILGSNVDVRVGEQFSIAPATPRIAGSLGESVSGAIEVLLPRAHAENSDTLVEATTDIPGLTTRAKMTSDSIATNSGRRCFIDCTLPASPGTYTGLLRVTVKAGALGPVVDENNCTMFVQVFDSSHSK